MSLGSSKYIFCESVSKSNIADKNFKALCMFVPLQASEEVGDTNTELKIDERLYRVYKAWRIMTFELAHDNRAEMGSVCQLLTDCNKIRLQETPESASLCVDPTILPAS